MKLALGDVHGNPYWKDFLKMPADEYYITGDYWDSFTVPFEEQRANFLELMDEAKKNPRLHLCIGNHDLHYIIYRRQKCSGFQYEHYKEIEPLVKAALPWLKVAYKTDDGYIISHAGFTKTFMVNAGCRNIDEVETMFEKNPLFLGFDTRSSNHYGNDPVQGPLWVRPESLMSDAYFKKQIVGHTERRGIERVTDERGDFIYIDTTNGGFHPYQWD
jgi:hypothetical protein